MWLFATKMRGLWNHASPAYFARKSAIYATAKLTMAAFSEEVSMPGSVERGPWGRERGERESVERGERTLRECIVQCIVHSFLFLNALTGVPFTVYLPLSMFDIYNVLHFWILLYRERPLARKMYVPVQKFIPHNWSELNWEMERNRGRELKRQWDRGRERAREGYGERGKKNTSQNKEIELRKE